MKQSIKQTKICATCKIPKATSEFDFLSKKSHLYRSDCRICALERRKQYYILNKADIKIKHKEYQKTPKSKEAKKKYYLDNRDEILAKIKKLHNDPERRARYNAARKIYRKKKMATDPIYRIKESLRKRVAKVLKGNPKSNSTFKFLGCTIPEFMNHLESQFKPGMTWDNYGLYGWHRDHIRPCSSFDLSKPDEQAKCFHYTNFQPLWATTDIARQNGDFESEGNIEKGDKWEKSVI
jgi:hypothetical protein